MNTSALPAALADIVDDFQALTEAERLQLLLEFSQGLPELPERLRDHPELLEQVVECQTPLFLTVETEQADGDAPERVRLYFKAPKEARPPAGLPESSTKDSTGSAPRKSWPSRTTCPNCWASPGPSLPCACAE